MFYEEIFRAFDKNGIKYLVAGGMAVNLHGVPRLTADLDVMVHLSENNVLNMVHVLKNLGYKPRAPVKAEDLADAEKRRQWIEEKELVVFTFNHTKTYRQIDVFVQNLIDFDEAYKRKKTIRLEGFSIPLLSINDLIAMKKKSNRLQDESDIQMLKRIEAEK